MFVLFIFLCVSVIVNGIELSGHGHSCTPSTPCTLCQGNCNDDNDCAGDSYCFKNYSPSNQVPGCTTPTHTVVPNQNYCAKYKRLSRILTDVATNCNSNSELEIWANVGIQGAETFALASESWKTGDFEITGDLTVPVGTITSTDIADGTITSADISDGTITTTDIADATITRDDIASHTIQSHQIYPDTIGSNEIAANSITSSELAANSVLTGSIVDGSITAADIADNTISGPQINHVVVQHSNGQLSWPWDNYNPGQIGWYFQHYMLIAERLLVRHSVSASSINTPSDKRIKTNIEAVPDNLALNMIRNLDAKYYHYADKKQRGDARVIGFIAQDVYNVIPEAVRIERGSIPSLMQDVEVEWTKTSGNDYIMTLKTEKVEPGQYTFIVDEDESVSLKTTDGSTFKTNSKYTKVFLESNNIEDFHYIDKQKIFAVAYAALQQVDKNQQTLTERVAKLEQTDIQALENTIKTQTALIAKLEERLSALENNN